MFRRDMVMADQRTLRMVRSVWVNCGWLFWRCRTRSWWRRARISASRALPAANSKPILDRISRLSATNTDIAGGR